VTCRACRSQLGVDDNTDATVRFEALFVLSITLGLRPGELRRLTWDLVDLDAGVIHVWRSASRSGDVKTPKSKRSLTLPKRALAALKAHKRRQAAERGAADEAYHDNDLMFCHEDGTMYTRDALNWRFSKVTRRAGIGTERDGLVPGDRRCCDHDVPRTISGQDDTGLKRRWLSAARSQARYRAAR
jgi:integrase